MKIFNVIPANAGIHPFNIIKRQNWIPAFAGMTILLALSLKAFAQDSINPYVIQQRGTIELHYTNVYYNPFAPPGDSDTRINLCNQSDLLRDPNGVGDRWRTYFPIVYDTNFITRTSLHKFDTLANWAPYGTSIGNQPWQRLFQSLHGDIIAGGLPGDSVIISKNEDVDFRAHGRIILKSGFHAMPGCRFHAYTEPKWDTAVFCDEFNDTAKFRNQWYITNGFGNDYSPQNCSSDTNARLVPDSDAHDGWALDVFMCEVPDTCACDSLIYWADTCESVQKSDAHGPHQSYFTSAILGSCPFPYQWRLQHTGYGPPSYAHAPYGKYEYRDKMPHVLYHNDDWGAGPFEIDFNETNNAVMGLLDPSFHFGPIYGPAKGYFKKYGSDSALFISHDTGWYWKHFLPTSILIDNIWYPVTNNWWAPPVFVSDTVAADAGWATYQRRQFPSSLINSTDTFTFYYKIWNGTSATNTKWTLSQTSGHWRVFHAPYYIDTLGDSLFFSKGYQPTSITITTDTIHDVQHSFQCYWDHTLNTVLLNPYGDHTQDSLLDSGAHSFTEPYGYVVGAVGYPIPSILTDTNAGWPAIDSTADTFTSPRPAYNTSPYQYHTYAIEYLPHEIRLLYDSMVVRRLPDRLIAPGDPSFDIVGQSGRFPYAMHASQLDIDNNGLDPSNIEKLFFDSHYYNPGCWDVTIDGKTYHAAHHLIDYIKVWDVPADVKIPPFPH